MSNEQTPERDEDPEDQAKRNDEVRGANQDAAIITPDGRSPESGDGLDNIRSLLESSLGKQALRDVEAMAAETQVEVLNTHDAKPVNNGGITSHPDGTHTLEWGLGDNVNILPSGEVIPDRKPDVDSSNEGPK